MCYIQNGEYITYPNKQEDDRIRHWSGEKERYENKTTELKEIFEIWN